MPLLKALKAYLRPCKYWFAAWLFAIVKRHPQLQHYPWGVNVIGYHRHVLGLGQALRMGIAALHRTAIPFVVRDFQAGIASHTTHASDQSNESSQCQFNINLIGINPDLLYRLPFWLGQDEWRTRYNIGYWFWELAQFPKAWGYARHLVDEIWVNTTFVQESLAQSGIAVHKIPFAVEFTMSATPSVRANYGIAAEDFVFLFSLDLDSYVERKNPLAVIRAFWEAFGENSGRARLILKMVHGERYPGVLASLAQTIANHPRITIIDEPYSAEQMRGLLQSADCYVSLHRAEGLGLAMAESMYLGKPVIATAYSGNLEFMNDDNAALVPYQLIPVKPNQYPHAQGQVWAEPDIAQAARYMQRMLSDDAWRTRLATHASAYMRTHHSLDCMAKAMQLRLEAITRGAA